VDGSNRHYLHTACLIPFYCFLRGRKNSVAWVRERTIPTERPQLVGEVSANFSDTGCHVVSVTDPYGSSLGFLDRSRYFFFHVAPQLYSRGWVDPVPDPLLLRKSGSAGNRTQDLWICSQRLWPLNHKRNLIPLGRSPDRTAGAVPFFSSMMWLETQ
jgi:hypothetical protein